MNHLETDRGLNTDLFSWKTQKELTVGFHGKSTNTAGEIVDEFVGFLKAKPQYGLSGREKTAKKGRTPAKDHYNGSLSLEETTNVQPALKHSCPQKNEPAIPSLRAVRLRSRGRERRTDFAQVGHSSLDGGFPLMQLELWHLTVVSTMPTDMRRHVQSGRRRKSRRTGGASRGR